jgi:hypothetical protein
LATSPAANVQVSSAAASEMRQRPESGVISPCLISSEGKIGNVISLEMPRTPIAPSEPLQQPDNPTNVSSTLNYHPQIDEPDNVTIHRGQYRTVIPTSNSFQLLSSLSDCEEDSDNEPPSSAPGLNRSCPERLCIYSKVEKLEKLTTELKEKLAIAEYEIENLLSENCTLKNKIKSYEGKIDHLKSLSKTSCKKSRSKINKNNNGSLTTSNQSFIELSTPLQNTHHTSADILATREFDTTPLAQRLAPTTPTPSPLISPEKEPPHASTPTRCSKSKQHKPHVYLFGDETVRGLSTRLIHSREEFGITSMIQSYAPTSQVLKSLHATSGIKKDDVILITVQNNEKDQYKLLTTISNTLLKYNCNRVVIINVCYGNVSRDILSHELKLFQSIYENCTVIDIFKNYLNNSHNRHSFLNWLKLKINEVLDSIFFNCNPVCQGVKSSKSQRNQPDNAKTFFRP